MTIERSQYKLLKHPEKCEYSSACKNYEEVKFTCNISNGRISGKDITSECLDENGR